MSKIFLFVAIDVRPGKYDEFVAALSKHISVIRTEAGCELIDIYRDTQKENVVNVWEIAADQSQRARALPEVALRDDLHVIELHRLEPGLAAVGRVRAGDQVRLPAAELRCRSFGAQPGLEPRWLGFALGDELSQFAGIAGFTQTCHIGLLRKSLLPA